MLLRAARADPAGRRYELLAPVYDVTSGERRLYAAARPRAIELLRLRLGAAVLDVACGAGRNFEFTGQRIGPSGRLVGVGRCPRMLARGRARAATHGWDNVQLAGAGAGQLAPSRLEALGAL